MSITRKELKYNETTEKIYSEVFLEKEDLVEALYQSITLSDLYNSEILKDTIFGKKVNRSQSLYNFLKDNCNIEVFFYLVQDDSIWKCEQIDWKGD